jgi:hypothetical protein
MHRFSLHRFSRLALLALVLLSTTACVVIEDGEVGVKKVFGAISDEPVPQGLTLQFPVVREIETWNVKLQELKEQAPVPSSEGLIVGLDTSLLFQLEPKMAPQIRKTVGRDYQRVLMIPYFRNAVRDVVSGYEVKNIYSATGRKEIAQKIFKFLTENLEPRGVRVVDVLLRDVALPAKFKESIEAKLTAEQRVQQKQFELQLRLLPALPLGTDALPEPERDLRGDRVEPAHLQADPGEVVDDARTARRGLRAPLPRLVGERRPGALGRGVGGIRHARGGPGRSARRVLARGGLGHPGLGRRSRLRASPGGREAGG